MTTTTTAAQETSQNTNEKFFRHFQHEVTDLQEEIERIADHSITGGERQDALEHCTAGIARLSTEVRDIITTLPAYDRQTYADAIKALSGKLQAVRTQVSGKQKFSFKTSAFKIPKNRSAVSIHDAAELANQTRAAGRSNDTGSDQSSMATTPLHLRSPTPELESSMASRSEDKLAHDAAVTDQTGRWIDLTEPDQRPTLITNTAQSIVYSISGNISLPLLRLRDVKHSIIIVPNITGPAYLDNISHCILVLGCRQFRMHNSSSCEIYLNCSSRPIIEDCDQLRFAPLPERFSDSSPASLQNQWDQIDDFKWLQAEQSPNWAILDASKRRNADFWKKVEALRGMGGIEDALPSLRLP